MLALVQYGEGLLFLCQGQMFNGAMKRACQQCGRPANYAPPKRKAFRQHRIVANDSHDLCTRCWQKMMDTYRAAEKVLNALR